MQVTQEEQIVLSLPTPPFIFLPYKCIWHSSICSFIQQIFFQYLMDIVYKIKSISVHPLKKFQMQRKAEEHRQVIQRNVERWNKDESRSLKNELEFPSKKTWEKTFKACSEQGSGGEATRVGKGSECGLSTTYGVPVFKENITKCF